MSEIVKAEPEVVAKITSEVVEEFLFTSGVGEKLDEQQKKLFLALAVRNNLDPFKREIYAVPYYNREKKKYDLSVVTGYEVYLKRAERSGKLAGWRVWTEGSISKGDLKAIVEIHRKDWAQPLVHEVWFREYNQDNRMWKSKPITMIKKVAIAQGFRLAFPEDVGGLPYTSDEIIEGEPMAIEEAEISPSPETPQNSPEEKLSASDDVEPVEEKKTPPEAKKSSEGWLKAFITSCQKLKAQFEEMGARDSYYAVLGNHGYEHCNEVRSRAEAKKLYNALAEQLAFMKEVGEGESDG